LTSVCQAALAYLKEHLKIRASGRFDETGLLLRQYPSFVEQSNFEGVSRYGGKWQAIAYGNENYPHKHLGTYDTDREAATAYREG
jgi:hypothetical protein